MSSTKLFLKGVALLLIWNFIIVPGSAQETQIEIKANAGIDFFEGTLAEALEKAKDENKPVFLDGYSSGCASCIKMTKTVFVKDKVADFYNTNFINIKVDLEKGEGPEVVEKYKIKSWPTYVFIDGSGTLLHRSGGFRPEEDFINDGSNALKTDKQYYTLKSMFEDGNREIDLLTNLVDVAHLAGDDPLTLQVSNHIFDNMSLTKVKDKKEFQDMAMNTAALGGSAFDVVIANKSFFVEKFGDEKISEIIYELAVSETRKAAKLNDETAYLNVLSLLDKHFSNEVLEENKLVMGMVFYKSIKDWDNYVETAKVFIPKFRNDNSNTLNGIAWRIYENVDDPQSLELAVEWVDRSIELKKTFANYDTKASLLYKLGDLNKALLMANVAVALAEADGDSATETEQLIKDIKKDLAVVEK